MILRDQVEKAAANNERADYIVFDGGTNDAYAPVLDMLGDVSQKSVETDTFAGAFRKTVEAIQGNWPKAVVIYVAVHRLGYRDRDVQKALHETALNICAEMGVQVANLYDECELDTADEAMCRKYSFDILKAGLPAPGKILRERIRILLQLKRIISLLYRKC